MSRPATYSSLQKTLHWAVLGLLVLNWLLHDAMQDAMRHPETPVPVLAYAHVVIGLIVLVLVLLRLWLRLTRGVPAPGDGRTGPLDRVADWVHRALYVLLLALPLSGAAAWFLGAEPAGEAHDIAFNALVVLAALHIAAALWHQFVRRDRLLARMAYGERGQTR